MKSPAALYGSIAEMEAEGLIVETGPAPDDGREPLRTTTCRRWRGGDGGEGVFEALGVAGVGTVPGLVAALGATRVTSGILFGVPATDPATFAGLSALLIGAPAPPGLRHSRGSVNIC